MKLLLQEDKSRSKLQSSPAGRQLFTTAVVLSAKNGKNLVLFGEVTMCHDKKEFLLFLFARQKTHRDVYSWYNKGGSQIANLLTSAAEVEVYFWP